MIDLDRCRQLDADDPLAGFRDRFAAPEAGTIFLDANSVGAMPRDVPARAARMLELWVEQRRRGWTVSDWLEKPSLLGASIAHLIGARPDDVIVTDNTSVNLFKLLSLALRLRPERKVVLTEPGNFPTDLFIAQGLARYLGNAVEVRAIDDREALLDAIGADTAVVYLSHVDYRTSWRWDMAEVCRRARAAGALTLWDVSHAAGAIDVDLEGSGADLAVGCTYKYLCGGPGSPSLLWIRQEHQDREWPTIAGWMGHADLFAFASEYEPAPGIMRQLTGTPAVIADELMAGAFDIWREVPIADLVAKHRSLSETLKTLLEQECGDLGVAIDSPADYERQGGHIAFRHEHGGPVSEALLAAGVVGSFRKPGVVRFGLGPLYLSHEDCWIAAQRLKKILETETWRDTKYQKVSV
jgi:kynureninase